MPGVTMVNYPRIIGQDCVSNHTQDFTWYQNQLCSSLQNLICMHQSQYPLSWSGKISGLRGTLLPG